MTTMKCEKHPDSDAVGVCVSCGRGVCSICKISYSNMIHCKECIETGRIGAQKQAQVGGYAQAGYPQAGYPQAGYAQAGAQTYGYPYQYPYYGYGYGYYGWNRRMYQAKPKPKGIPNPSLFKAGAAGCVLTGILSIILGIYFMYSIISYNTDPGQGFMIMSFMVMLVSFPLAVGSYGFNKNYGSEWGLLGAVGLSITSVLFFVCYVMATIYPMEWSNEPNIMYIYFGNLCYGIGIFMYGISVHHAKPYLKVERLAQGLIHWATGGLVIGAILLMAFIGMFMAGWAVIAISLFLIGNEIAKAPTPPPFGEEDDKATQPEWAQAGQPGAPGPTPGTPSAPTTATSYEQGTGTPAAGPKTINCPKCRQPFEVTNTKRPLVVNCTACGQRLLLKK